MIKEKEEFEKIYYETYDITLKYIVCNSSNINDVNDIIQEVYLEVYKKLNKMDYVNDINSYIIGIAKNKIRKHYYKFNRLKTLSIFNKNDDEIEYVDIIKSDIDLEKIIINSNLYEKAWDYVKNKKDIIAKVFFLYYKCDYTIDEISNTLNINKSCVKNYLYRTINEIKKIFGGE